MRHALLILLAASVTVPPGCRARTPVAEPSSDRQGIRVGGRDRTYIVRAPAASRNARALPLVIVMHGGGGNALNAESMTGFTEKGRSEGFVVLYPEGTSRRGPLLTWNAGHCCGYAMEQRVDDVGFMGALIDRVAMQYPIDRKRVYATGMSNGAMMAHRLGIELSEKIAAIAPVVGAVFGDEDQPRAPVSAIMINGMMDESVPYRGGPTGGRFVSAWDGTPARPALDQARFWATAAGCNPSLRSEDRGKYLRGVHDCPAPLGVEIYSVKDNGHAWPGGRAGTRRGDVPSTSLDATDVIWDFFRAHARP